MTTPRGASVSCTTRSARTRKVSATASSSSSSAAANIHAPSCSSSRAASLPSVPPSPQHHHHASDPMCLRKRPTLSSFLSLNRPLSRLGNNVVVAEHQTVADEDPFFCFSPTEEKEQPEEEEQPSEAENLLPLSLPASIASIASSPILSVHSNEDDGASVGDIVRFSSDETTLPELALTATPITPTAAANKADLSLLTSAAALTKDIPSATPPPATTTTTTEAATASSTGATATPRASLGHSTSFTQTTTSALQPFPSKAVMTAISSGVVAAMSSLVVVESSSGAVATSLEEELREVTDPADDETTIGHNAEQQQLLVLSPAAVGSGGGVCRGEQPPTIVPCCSPVETTTAATTTSTTVVETAQQQQQQQSLPDDDGLRLGVVMQLRCPQEQTAEDCTYTSVVEETEQQQQPQERNEQLQENVEQQEEEGRQKHDRPSQQSTESTNSNERNHRLVESPSSVSPSPSRFSRRLLSPLPPTVPTVFPSAVGPLVTIPFYVSNPPLCDPLESFESRKTFCITALRFLRHYCPHWAVHTASFQFHFRALLSATSSSDLQNYVVVLNRLRTQTPTASNASAATRKTTVGGSSVCRGSRKSVSVVEEDIVVGTWAVEEALEELDLVRSVTDRAFCPVRRKSASVTPHTGGLTLPPFSSLYPASSSSASPCYWSHQNRRQHSKTASSTAWGRGWGGGSCEVAPQLLRGAVAPAEEGGEVDEEEEEEEDEQRGRRNNNNTDREKRVRLVCGREEGGNSSRRKVRKRGGGEGKEDLQRFGRQLREALDLSSQGEREEEENKDDEEQEEAVNDQFDDQSVVGEHLDDGGVFVFSPVFSFQTALSLFSSSLPSLASPPPSYSVFSSSSSTSSFSTPSCTRRSGPEQNRKGRKVVKNDKRGGGGGGEDGRRSSPKWPRVSVGSSSTVCEKEDKKKMKHSPSSSRSNNNTSRPSSASPPQRPSLRGSLGKRGCRQGDSRRGDTIGRELCEGQGRCLRGACRFDWRED
eukprot:GHVS01091830.1.p1 GENE.GHVS01091830.1~~GHVS01091830.1.p1  ORF type:complete len:1045 (-),score=340.44 GHVS01091830.1:181-3162(-)